MLPMADGLLGVLASILGHGLWRGLSQVDLYCKWLLETSTERHFKLLAQGWQFNLLGFSWLVKGVVSLLVTVTLLHVSSCIYWLTVDDLVHSQPLSTTKHFDNYITYWFVNLSCLPSKAYQQLIMARSNGQ